MTTMTKVTIGVAGVAIVFLLLKERAAADQANLPPTETAPAPAPLPTLANIAARSAVSNSRLAQILRPTTPPKTISTADGQAVGVWRS